MIDKDLTPKQKKWLQCYCDYGSETFGNATKSALVAYNLDVESQYASARQIGWENLTKLDIQMIELMDNMGLTDAKLMIKLLEGLEAVRPYGRERKLYGDNGVRLRALELALKLKGKLRDDVVPSGGFFSTDKLKIEIVEPKPVDCEVGVT